MKKLVTQFGLFLCFCFPFYVLCLILLQTFSPFGVLRKNINYPIGGSGHMHSRMKEVQELSDLDVLFIGSSHAYSGFDTRLFEEHGLRVFNLGSSSQTPLQTLLLLKRYLDQLQPKTVIYEVNPYAFSVDGVESALDIIANDENDFLSLEMALRINHLKVYNTLIFGFYSDLFNIHKGFKEGKQKGKETYISGGYIEKDLAYYEPKSFAKSIWQLVGKQKHAFEEISNILLDKDIETIYVQAPVVSAYYNSIINNSSFDSLIDSYGAYYNYNKLLQMDDSYYFHDYHHLNQNGAKKISQEVLKLLMD